MGELSRREIESHSSSLTNMRIANLMRMVCMAELEVNNVIPPSVQHVTGYHSALTTLFFETNEIYEDLGDFGEKIHECYIRAEKQMHLIKYGGKQVQLIHLIIAIQNCKKWRYLMHRGMQKKNYFFRFAKHDPKGLKESLELFKKSEIYKEEKDGNKISGHSKQLQDAFKK